MLLTGFDSKYLNTLYVDKNLNHNNRLYHALDRRFAELRKRFDDFWVFNCTPDPRNCGLKSLPFYPYEKAVEYARAECSKPMDTAGWYDSSSKVKSESDGI